MDDFQPQPGEHRIGHEAGDFSIRGIVVFLGVLVVSAVFTFIAAAGIMNFFEWYERTHDQAGSAVQQQLSEQRGEMATREGVRPQPDWYNREIDAKVLRQTFAAPRLQDDDAADMGFFVDEEKKWLETTGRNQDGSTHIPIDRAIDLVSKQGLPSVNGTFTAQPALGPLEAVSDFSKRRVQEAGGQVQQQNSRKK